MKQQSTFPAELGASAAEARGEGGELTYRWGNVCMHFMSVGFLERCAEVRGSEQGEANRAGRIASQAYTLPLPLALISISYSPTTHPPTSRTAPADLRRHVPCRLPRRTQDGADGGRPRQRRQAREVHLRPIPHRHLGSTLRGEIVLSWDCPTIETHLQ